MFVSLEPTKKSLILMGQRSLKYPTKIRFCCNVIPKILALDMNS